VPSLIYVIKECKFIHVTGLGDLQGFAESKFPRILGNRIRDVVEV
jgi:hypothetical protein